MGAFVRAGSSLKSKTILKIRLRSSCEYSALEDETKLINGPTAEAEMKAYNMAGVGYCSEWGHC